MLEECVLYRLLGRRGGQGLGTSVRNLRGRFRGHNVRRMVIMLTYAVVDRVTGLGAGYLSGAGSFGSTVCDVKVPRKQRSQLGL